MLDIAMPRTSEKPVARILCVPPGVIMDIESTCPTKGRRWVHVGPPRLVVSSEINLTTRRSHLYIARSSSP